jgi:murein L,D-transpeptidase YafK
MLRLLALTLCTIPHIFASQQDFLPSSLVHLDPAFSHHVIVVEKSTHKLFLYENSQTLPKLVGTFPIATGKITGDKLVSGDKKTPEGVYFFQKFHESKELIRMYGDYGKIYGIGAFTMNYPNFIDSKRGKTGGGIWLHSTNDEQRIAKRLDSRGCVVVNDENLKTISQYIDLRRQTPIVVKETIDYWPKETWSKQREKLLSFVESWRKSWEEVNLNNYIDHYDPEHFRDGRNRGLASWKNHKSNVFKRSKNVKVDFKNISVLRHKNYAVINLIQHFQSNLMNDSGKKTLYLIQNEKYEWKIVHEYWKKNILDSTEIAFTPSPRFFSN